MNEGANGYVKIQNTPQIANIISSSFQNSLNPQTKQVLTDLATRRNGTFEEYKMLYDLIRTNENLMIQTIKLNGLKEMLDKFKNDYASIFFGQKV